MTKFSPDTLWSEMAKCNTTGNHRTAVIVYASSNWPDKDYSEESRSYRSHSDQWGWDPEKMGRCRIGDCLDGTDSGVRLDWQDWEVEYWYWEN